ncbi:MAG: DUF1987 domain-containing protein [Bacteroidales bacterium]
MEDMVISGTNKTPTIIFNAQSGVLEIRGTSIPENPMAFYQPVIDWVDKYSEKPRNTIVNIDLEYFNTSSSKILLNIFKAIARVRQAGCELEINWYFEEDDEEAIESGHDFSMFTKVDFNFIARE